MSDAGKPYDEKRDFIRMKIPAPLEASLTGPNGTLQAKCTELSGGGMQIELDQALTEGAEFEVNMVSEHGHSPELHARVRVVRVSTEGDRHLAGLEILEVLG